MNNILSSIKSSLSRNASNAIGWKTKRKIVVFESDDWGSIRMPSKTTFDNLLKAGIRVDQSMYDSNDCLESKVDIEALMNVLTSNQSKQGSKPIFTFNTVMQNPDFQKIKEIGFDSFVGEYFYDSYQRYYGQNLKSIWQNAIDENLVQPQFHAREHLNSFFWLKDLKEGNVETLKAFENEFFGLKTNTSSRYRKHYLATYYTESKEELNYVIEALQEGLEMFENEFGMTSKTFIASNYFWPKQIEQVLFDSDVKGIQGQRKQKLTSLMQEKPKNMAHYTGEKNELGQLYMVRNVIFEPYSNQNIDWAEYALGQIREAFFWNKPAILSTHRINYVGGLNDKQRDNNLKHLKNLIEKLIVNYPTIEFMSSDQLLEMMRSDKQLNT